MKDQDIHDAGFTAGYGEGIVSKPREYRAPMELILLEPGLIPTYGAAFEQGYAKGKEDRRVLEEWRINSRATELEAEERDHGNGR